MEGRPGAAGADRRGYEPEVEAVRPEEPGRRGRLVVVGQEGMKLVPERGEGTAEVGFEEQRVADEGQPPAAALFRGSSQLAPRRLRAG